MIRAVPVSDRTCDREMVSAQVETMQVKVTKSGR